MISSINDNPYSYDSLEVFNISVDKFKSSSFIKKISLYRRFITLKVFCLVVLFLNIHADIKLKNKKFYNL